MRFVGEGEYANWIRELCALAEIDVDLVNVVSIDCEPDGFTVTYWDPQEMDAGDRATRYVHVGKPRQNE